MTPSSPPPAHATIASDEATILHAAWTYAIRDLAGAAWGVLVFAAALVAPGYCFAHLVNPAAFRTRALREQLAWSVALSFGPGVLLDVAAVWLGGATGGAILLLVLMATAAWLFRKHQPPRDVTRRDLFIALAVLVAWAVLVLASLVDFGTQQRLWMSVTAYDHGLRTAFVDAVLRTGLPPVDPVYWPGHDVAMRYYYFWYAVCGAVARLAHISGRQALIASCVWPPVGVVAMLALFSRYVLVRRGRELTRLTATGAALLGVTGLDLLVTLALHLLHTPVLADMEWWSLDQVASWPDTFLWVPHHAAALVASLSGLLLLHLAAATEARRTRLSLAVLAGLSFAAAFGMSAYLAVGAAIISLGWLLAALRSRDRWRALQGAAVGAVVSGLALSGFLRQLTRPDGVSTRNASPLYFGLREILSPAMLAASPPFHRVAAAHPWRARELAAAILLLPGWGVELGFYAIVLVVAVVRWQRNAPGERVIAWLTLCGLASASFVRSGVIATNDYGLRAALLPQFFLLIVGALVFAPSTGALRRCLWLLIFIGAAGCAYQLILLRTYLPWQQAHHNGHFGPDVRPDLRDVGERTYALREAYTALEQRIPSSARIQFDPASTSFYLYPHLLYADRQMITAEITCSTSFGGDPARCATLQNGIRQLFPEDSASTPAAARAHALCHAIGAQYLVVTRWDAAWEARTGWVWTLPAAVQQPSSRVLQCE